MTRWLKKWTPEDVQKADDPAVAFAEYCQQKAGIPWPTQKDLILLRKQAKEFFNHYPNTDWYTLCRVADWCRARKRRIPRVWMVVQEFRYAWSAGYLPELDPSESEDMDVEAEIKRALEVEKRPAWRRRLLNSRGVQTRRGVIEEWKTEQKSLRSQ